MHQHFPSRFNIHTIIKRNLIGEKAALLMAVVDSIYPCFSRNLLDPRLYA
jgi:hypothetical protein